MRLGSQVGTDSVALRGQAGFFFTSRRRHTRCLSDWSSDVCSSDLEAQGHEKNRCARLVGADGVSGGCATAAPQAQRQSLCGVAAGGPADVLARLISEKLKDHIGQSVIVQNRRGAGGTIAAAAVAKAEPDGTSLLLVSSGHAGAPALFPNLPYDQRKDFVPVIALAQSPIVVLVDAKSSYHSIQQLVDAAKAAAGKLNFGTGGGGATLTALSAIMLRRAVGFDAAAIYFPGSGPANIALLGGTIDFSFDTVSGAVTSAKRSAVLPAGPTIAETVSPGFAVTGWVGVLAPTGIDPAIREQLNHGIN